MKQSYTPIPEFDLDEIKEEIRVNHAERLKFVRYYAKWVRDHPNKEVFRQQKELIDGQMR